jgi:hypothetical protein
VGRPDEEDGMTYSNWEEHLTDDERIALADMRTNMELYRLELMKAKREFDRACDDIYLLSRQVRDRIAAP